MAKNCPHCMTELPANATFCYECGKPQPSDKDEPRRPPRWLPILLFVLVIFTAFSLFRMSQPKDYMGTYELEYTAEDDATYHLTLSFGTIDEACESITHAGGTDLSTYLYVTDASGNSAMETFLPLVDRVKAIGLPVGGAFAAELSETEHDASGWNCITSNDSTAGSNIIRWTFDMENGDTLILSHTVEYTE
ncbi:MAG: zinc ribbon domain-containing protein [Clostridia bacterium]|nr:zinc ribbon domain-containing protein [Clostridia bacterium]